MGKKALSTFPPKVKEGKEGLAKCASPKLKGKKALPSAPPMDPPTSKRRTRSTIQSKTALLEEGDRLTDKDMVCWLNPQVYHNEIGEPRVWTLAVVYIGRRSRCMLRVESGTRLDNTAWCRRHIFWLVPMTRNVCNGLCVPSISCLVGAFQYLGLGTPKLHSFDPFFLGGHEEAFANHQAPCLGIANRRLVLWFSKLEHHEAAGGAPGYLSYEPLVLLLAVGGIVAAIGWCSYHVVLLDCEECVV